MKYNNEALQALAELNEDEMKTVIGARGVFLTLSHECHMNTAQWFLTCCK
ncbi:MAG: lacticin 481 family lantibiotic [Corynebacterium sp.]|nr:lacticin 481 family lantibiotic [Corynebacterium sp.]